MLVKAWAWTLMFDATGSSLPRPRTTLCNLNFDLVTNPSSCNALNDTVDPGSTLHKTDVGMTL